jgi:integral membrane protein (TIGR00529 family)
MDLNGIFSAIKRASANEVTIKLWVSLSLIRIFELILRENNVLSSMMSAVKTSFSSRKAVIISMPLLIGMLPSLGGAYFSAPMVKEATIGLEMTNEEKAFINYWFRHPWEYVLPLYPGLLLAAAISGVAVHSLVSANMVSASVLLGTGFIYSMREIKNRTNAHLHDKENPEGKGRAGMRAALSFLPVILVLLLAVILRVELHYALLIIIIPLFLIFRYPAKDIIRIMRHGFALDIVVLILGIMLFKETMEASGAVRNLSRVFIDNGLPVLPILCLLPFLTGLLTGLTVGFVGSTFPLLISIAGGASVPVISMAFAAGFIGVLLSPVHLCLILTKEYFKADLWGIYRKLIPSCIFIFVAALAQYLIFA